MSKPYEDAERLRKLYCREMMSANDIADELGCSKKTILRWLDKHGIETRDHGHPPDNYKRPWRDEARLRQLYVEDQRSAPDIADEWNTTTTTIYQWLDEHGIETRTGPADRLPHFGVTSDDYEYWQNTHDGEKAFVYHHRLLAVVEHGFEAVAKADHVHHETGHPRDNRPEVVEPVDAASHNWIHRHE